MNYEKIENNRYEKRWKSLKRKFSKDRHYTSNIPNPEAISFMEFLKKKMISGSFLDLGCGNGRHAVLFAKNKFSVHGIDFSKSAISLARQNAKQNNVNVKFKVGSVFDLPYKEKLFDVVFDTGCLHHLRKSQWSQYKQNVLKVIKPGGYYYLKCFSNNYAYIPGISPRTKKRNWTLMNLHYNHFFTNKEVMDLFKDDFKIIKKIEVIRKYNPKKRFKVFYMKRYE
jgi:2-polyprenyl-3-methyl-5-hydroxy-6-metoxy-1,4-benzoquinol methylase